jgi:DNA-binding response OmpR family regulator
MPNDVLTKVLIIDDEISLTDMLNEALRRDFTVCVANSGVDGVKAVEEFKPDVIVLDLMMPGMNGWEVCRTVRAFSRVPILVLSAVVNPDKVMQALDAGADDYMIKPVSLTNLTSRLNRLTQQTETIWSDNTQGAA